jgi:hypothetical protein
MFGCAGGALLVVVLLQFGAVAPTSGCEISGGEGHDG